MGVCGRMLGGEDEECVHGTVSLEDSLALLGNLVMGVPYIPTFH